MNDLRKKADRSSGREEAQIASGSPVAGSDQSLLTSAASITSHSAKPVERLFPFVLRSRILLVGRDTLGRSKSKLHFVLVTTDISDNSLAEIRSDFAHYPIVQHYTPADLEKHFRIKGAKVV